MKEISSFIVEKGTPGFTFGTKEKKMGIKGSSTYELIFTDCRIPKENMLGKQGQGFKIAMHTLDGGRIGIASQALGIAEGALERTVAYTKERKQFGKSISGFQNTQFQLLIWLPRWKLPRCWYTRLHARRTSTRPILRSLTL